MGAFRFHQYQLCDLYENDFIFDKFKCCSCGNGLRAATGSYSVFGVSMGSTETATLEASRSPMRRHVPIPLKPARALSSITGAESRERPGVGGKRYS